MESGNPFLNTSNELIALVTRIVAPSAAAANMLKIEAIGTTQYEDYCKRLQQGDSVHNKISKNNFQIFSTAKIRKEKRNSNKISELKSNCSLFSRLFIAIQTPGRDIDMGEFFSHEN